jgi:hypothetical protein
MRQRPKLRRRLFLVKIINCFYPFEQGWTTKRLFCVSTPLNTRETTPKKDDAMNLMCFDPLEYKGDNTFRTESAQNGIERVSTLLNTRETTLYLT